MSTMQVLCNLNSNNKQCPGVHLLGTFFILKLAIILFGMHATYTLIYISHIIT